MRINTSNITGWKIATKTKGLRAKPLVSLLVDRTVLNKFLVDTLEGKEPLADGAVICIGESNDAWQQMPRKLLQKYEVKAIDADGWMICEPRPDNAVKCVEVTAQFLEVQADSVKTFSIIGHYGTIVGGEHNVQTGEIGDFICQNQTDPTDVWIVRRKIFTNTYTIKD